MSIDTTPIGWGIAIAGIAIALAAWHYSENNRHKGFTAQISSIEMIVILDSKTGQYTIATPTDNQQGR